MQYKEIVDIIKLRNIKEIYYFNVDHFEPCDLVGNIIATEEQVGELVKRYSVLQHAKRNSIFIRPYFEVVFDGPISELIYRVGDDKIGFKRTVATEHIVKLSEFISKNSDFNIQMHIHHENFTFRMNSIKNDINQYLVFDSTRYMDYKRLQLYIKLSRNLLGKAITHDQWFFVHGKWALNSSDDRVCNVNNESAILLKLGCRGDFSFPAGRQQCDPGLKGPFTFTPVNVERCYDYIGSGAKLISNGSNIVTKDRLFAWSSEINHTNVSLDYYSDEIGRHLTEHNDVVKEWINKSPILDGRLFIKTHCHSLNPLYIRNNKYPLDTDNVIKIHDVLRTSAKEAGTKLTYINVNEAFFLFSKIDKGELLAC